MRQILLITSIVLAFSPLAIAQVENRGGWSQGDGYSENRHGQYSDGTSWQTQHSVGTTFYNDTTGKHCWTEHNTDGSSFTSCN